MSGEVVMVTETGDWDLILFTVWFGNTNNLPRHVQDLIDESVWEIQDGYGVPGFTPPQGYDWSGIRDSSAKAKAKMAEVVRDILGEYGINGFRVWKVKYGKTA